MGEEFSKIEDALQALTEGRVVIVVDDEDRENEGDFIAAAEKVTPEIDRVHDHARPRASSACRSCPSWPSGSSCARWSSTNTAPHRTPFTVPVDHKSCRTGISAEERARTIRAIVDPATQAGRPGPARPPVPPGGQGGGRAPPRRAHRGDGRPGPAGGPHAGRRPLRDPRRHPRGQPRAAARDRRRVRPADRLDRDADHAIAGAARSWSTGWPRPSCRPATARGRIIGYGVKHEPEQRARSSS